MIITAQDVKLKHGYKQTEVGVIPEDWHAEELSKMCWFQEGPGLRNWQFTNSGMKVINVTNLENGYLNLERTSRYISTEEFQRMYQHFEVDDKDIVVASSGNSYAKVAVVRKQDLPLVMNTSVIRFKPLKNLDYGFLLTFLKSDYFKKQIDLLITGGAQPNFGPAHLRKIKLVIPSDKLEQTAIATALGDVDTLIASLDQLIAKKRDIKQATMQQLLTGKTRLPGFSRGWQLFNLADNSTLKARIGWQGLTTTEYLREGEYYLVTGTDFIDGKIDWDACHFVDAKRYDQDKNIQLRIGDVLLTKDGTIGKVAYIDHLPGAATLNSGVFVIRPKNNMYYSLYLYYVLSSSIFDKFLQQLKAGSTISHLYQRDFVGFNFWAPSREEQESIATILSDMDAEISALEQRRDKTRALKQAMMQDLLTGKTRLI